MTRRIWMLRLAMPYTLLALAFIPLSSRAAGDEARGARAFGQCAACHSLEPGRHLTGPSLAGVVGRAAGTAEGFRRYSEALRSSGLTWNAGTLNRWLADPQGLVPGNSMRIRPVSDPGVRADLIAFLETAGTDDAGAAGGMGGMQAGRMLDLGEQTASQQVTAIRYCGDGYHVTLGTGKTYTFWEFNLRFKTDSSPQGPPPGQPAIVQAGMQGDRAQVVFASPEEISAFIRAECME